MNTRDLVSKNIHSFLLACRDNFEVRLATAKLDLTNEQSALFVKLVNDTLIDMFHKGINSITSVVK
jgi:hypothetical protein